MLAMNCSIVVCSRANILPFRRVPVVAPGEARLGRSSLRFNEHGACVRRESPLERVVDLLGPNKNGVHDIPPEMIFTSGRTHALPDMLAPFFGGRVPA